MKKLFLSLLLVYPLLCAAQEPEPRHRLSVGASISTDDTYDYSAGYHYMICGYAGVGARVGAWSFFPDDGIIGETAEERDRRENLFFQPSVLLVSPSLFSIKNCTFHIECEPSLMISMRQDVWAPSGADGRYTEYSTDCLSWHCDIGLSVRYRNLDFHAGYSMSNLDINREYDGSGSYSKKLINNIGVRVSALF